MVVLISLLLAGNDRFTALSLCCEVLVLKIFANYPVEKNLILFYCLSGISEFIFLNHLLGFFSSCCSGSLLITESVFEWCGGRESVCVCDL